MAAFNAIGKKAGSRGIDDVTIESFRKNLDAELTAIQQALKGGTFAFSQLRPVAIPKKNPGEYRPVLVPTVRDRVVQRAILHQIRSKLISHTTFRRSHAFRSGVGVRSAVLQLTNEMRAGRRTVLIVDIENFFPSIDQTVVFNDLEAILPDQSLRSLLGQLSAWEIGELSSLPINKRRCFPKCGTGLPQGSALSPLLSNFYLRDFDAKAESRGLVAIRYADDIAVPCQSIEEAEEAYRWIAAELDARGLRVPPLRTRKARIVNVGDAGQKGVEYLGCFIARRGTGFSIRPARHAIDNAVAYIGDVLSPESTEPLARRYAALNHFLSSWLATYSRLCNGVARERKVVLEHAENALRVLLVRRGLLGPAADLTDEQKAFLGLDGMVRSLSVRGAPEERRRPGKALPYDRRSSRQGLRSMPVRPRSRPHPAD